MQDTVVNLHQFTAIVFMRWRITCENRFTRFRSPTKSCRLVAILADSRLGGRFRSRRFSEALVRQDRFLQRHLRLESSWAVVSPVRMAGASDGNCKRSESCHLRICCHSPVSLFARSCELLSSLVSVTIFLIAPSAFASPWRPSSSRMPGLDHVRIGRGRFGMVSAVSYQIRGLLRD